jgi:hypothetical protein
VILVGPGPRARALSRFLEACAEGVEVRAFGDPADLALESGRAGLVLLDVDATPLEDVGYVRRFLAAHAGIELVALGTDARGRAARALGARRHTPWPPDVEELAALVAAARAAAQTGGRGAASAPPAATAGAAARTETPTAPPAPAAADDELELVRAILDDTRRRPDGEGGREREPADEQGPAQVESQRARSFREAFPDDDGDEEDDDDADEAGGPAGVALDDPHAPARARAHEDEDEDNDDEVDERHAPTGLATRPERDDAADARAGRSGAPPAAHEPPAWWRAQVADLADVAQRIDLALRRLAAAAPDIDEGAEEEAHARLRELEGDVARLLQFARTLGYVAAPPAAGTQVFDLGEIVHLHAASLASSGADAPRCQFKTARGADVRSDKELVSQALDAAFFLVRCTAHKGDLVRAQVGVVDDGGAWVELTLDFPSGPLEGLPIDEITAPYGLADLYPELGPNALAAAAGIVAGQGGHLALQARPRARLTWTLRLPRAGRS